MRVVVLSLAILLLVSAPLGAGEKLTVARMLDLDFQHPGRIVKVDAQGDPPVSENVFQNTYVLVLPRQVKLTLTIANDNPREDHYHIRVVIQDEQKPVDKVEAVLLPEDAIKDFWVASYRYHFTLVRKHASGKGNFVTALVKLDVYGPGPKPARKPPEE